MVLLLMTFLALIFAYSDFIGVFFIFSLFFFFCYMMDSLDDFSCFNIWGFCGIDNYSFYMVSLCMFIFGVVMVNYDCGGLIFMFLLMFIFMVMMFCSLDLLWFFVFFELSLVPIFIIIIFYGLGSERFLSSMYMLIYTLFGSLFMLFNMFLFYQFSGSLSISCFGYFCLSLSTWMVFFYVMMFLIKVPMVFLHIWLPKAHVDAPVYGSMVLASVMLKMGGYGVIRFMSMFIYSIIINDLFMTISVLGSSLLSFYCLFGVDQKVLVAYSSVIHMGMMLAGVFTETGLGITGGLIMMLSHGFISSLMFYVLNYMYMMTGSRLLMLNTGGLSVFCMLSIYWLVTLISNLGCPPFFSVFAEIYLISSLLKYFFYYGVFLVVVIFFVSCFIINMFTSLSGMTMGFIDFSESIMLYYSIFFHLYFLLILSIYIALVF